MVVIRLSRGGTNKSPFYQILVADSRRSRDGRFIERLGFYNPMARGPETHLEVNLERVNHWIGCGAIPSERVTHLIKLAKTDTAINNPAPKKAALKTAQIAASLKAEKAKPKAEAKSDETPAAEASAPETDAAKE